MKTQYTLFFIAMVAAIVSCSKNEEPITLSERVVFSASMEYPQTKAALNSEGTKVFWEPGDSINLFYGKVSSKFHATATEVSANTTFTGTLGVDENGIDKFIAVYPYREGNTYDGELVIVDIPDIQIARTGSFDRDAFVTIAASTDHRLQFKNLCGGVAFTVMQANVNKIVFSGSNGEYIAGKAKVTLDDKGVPEITAIIDGRTSIELRAPEGTCFEMGKWYYIAALPIELSKGFTMEFYGKQKTELKNEKSVRIKRAVWGKLVDADENSIVPFEDANFKAYCVENFDKDGDGEISVAEARTVKTIFVYTDNITSLNGIQAFVNLEVLVARGRSARGKQGYYVGDLLPEPAPGTSVATGQLSVVNLSGLEKITMIDISCNNIITDFYPKSCPELQELACDFCNILNLDVSNNPKLRNLSCAQNQLCELNVCGNYTLENLDCDCNELLSLDLSNNPTLKSLQCEFNHLSTLDIHNNPLLTFVSGSYNQISSIDVSNNIFLGSLGLFNNQLESLDISTCIGLTHLYCAGNKLSALDVSNNAALTYLECQRNQITALDISQNTALTLLDCGFNHLSTLDVSNILGLTELHCSSNQLISIDVSNNTGLKELYCYDNQMSLIDVSKNPALVNLNCESNQLATLDVSKNTALANLNCKSNQLAALDVSSNPVLARLICDYNQLVLLDLSHNAALNDLSCTNNLLTSIDLSTNTTLTDLCCGYNQLTTLDVSNFILLTLLECGHNQLKELDVSHNTALTHLLCPSNQMTSLDVSNNSELSFLDCSSSYLTELWMKNGQDKALNLYYDSSVTTIKYK